ncbi:MAG: putative toxin-antitoxin system toxin component, PIN family [Anaerolineae bacterium]|uniref:putative toxin-antitoxin system toxin component, PIN family n=1 Tax=Candidatus Amarolinea dominans TaxID=3140696 RepID=UPI001D1F310E|nr:putative toxin-antitoxin system toxin component, PIN family [Anaerolineae bacterium]MBK7200794.1 putative toxin-antitoxin system toxin component, PIN family [Anaerolineae bacterium]MBK9234247.1 putative toxin-antitoxin system toxin component, PIN family [Anaerolineae bacterium]
MTEPAEDTLFSPGSDHPGGKFRAVLDTNVPIAAHLSRNSRSPTVELLERWRAREFTQLYSDDLLAELVEKLQARKIAADAADRYVADLIMLGEHVEVAPEQIQAVIKADPDDDAILACAVVGRATHLVTYDPHFAVLDGAFQGIPILDGLHFLYVVRGDRPT